MEFLDTLRERNSLLFWFGLMNLLAALLFLVFSRVWPIEISGTNGWYKPTKFALSTTAFSWAMGWFMFYLPPAREFSFMSWAIVVLLGLEVLYIAIQAGRGELSHYNMSTPFYRMMYSFMALAATFVTLIAAWVMVRYFQNDFPQLPDYYVWAIRIGLLLFVIFSFEGFVMGSRLSHTIGGPDGSGGLPFLNWSRQYGDPRVAHFVGMHALQVLPVLSLYLLRSVKLTVIVGILYAATAVWVLAQALWGKPLIS